MRVRSHTKGAIAKRVLRDLRDWLFEQVDDAMRRAENDDKVPEAHRLRLELARAMLRRARGRKW